MYEHANLWGLRPQYKSDVEKHDDAECSERALAYAQAGIERDEKLETLAKAAAIVGRHSNNLSISESDIEAHAEVNRARHLQRTLAKVAGQIRGGGRSFEKLSGKVYGKPVGWNTQRDITDPQSEAEAGVDFDSETDDVDVDDFLKMIDSADLENDDETAAHLHRCGLHLCKAKLAHLSGDHEQCTRSINAAMASYGKFHQALKSATED